MYEDEEMHRLNDISAELIKKTGQHGAKYFSFHCLKTWCHILCQQPSDSIDIPCKQASIVHYKRKTAGLSKTRDFWGAGGLSKRP